MFAVLPEKNKLFQGVFLACGKGQCPVKLLWQPVSPQPVFSNKNIKTKQRKAKYFSKKLCFFCAGNASYSNQGSRCNLCRLTEWAKYFVWLAKGISYNGNSSLGVAPHQLSLGLIGAGSEKKPFEPDQDNRRTGGYACVGKWLTILKFYNGLKLNRFLPKRFFILVKIATKTQSHKINIL